MLGRDAAVPALIGFQTKEEEKMAAKKKATKAPAEEGKGEAGECPRPIIDGEDALGFSELHRE